MLCFILGIVILVAGYMTWGRLVERILAPDDRITPAISNFDGVDYVPLPRWKNMLIELLNIAGIGPVIGVILGIKFGSIVFLIIPIGNVFGGAVYDFVSGMMSLRSNGANLPTLVRQNLPRSYWYFSTLFTIFLLILVVAVFINIPAQLIDGLLIDHQWFWTIVGAIFLYYLLATMFPIDKIIGRIYPLFGGCLLIGTTGIFVSILYHAWGMPALLEESAAFAAGKTTAPIIPCLFVTIACGILSGFHATQAPIVARTMMSEHQARSIFYGMMIVEGLVAMTWAAAALAIYNLNPEFLTRSATAVLGGITDRFLWSGLGTVTVIAVIILAVTSGDTAMRSLRLCLGEILAVEQRPIFNRIILCIPIGIVVGLLLWWSNRDAQSFAILWNYFAWGNQVLAASTFMAATVWLIRQRKNYLITLLPGTFILFVVITYILWTSRERGGPVGFGLPVEISYIIAGITSVIIGGAIIRYGKLRQ